VNPVMGRPVLESIEGEYRRYKGLGERALEQMSDEELSAPAGASGNSATTLVWHLSGNFLSRFTDFPAADGEKPWRDRDSEFQPRTVTRAELMAQWEKGWETLFHSLAPLRDDQLEQKVTIRGVSLSIVEALHRSLTHAAYHVGQMVFLAKQLRGAEWDYLTIPPGGTAAYNQNPTKERAPR